MRKILGPITLAILLFLAIIGYSKIVKSRLAHLSIHPPSNHHTSKHHGQYPDMSYDKIILLGDSLTDKALKPDGWGTLLATEYSRRMDVIVRGFSGYSSLNLKFAVEPILREVPSERIAIVTLLIGTNDYSIATDHQHVDVNDYQDNLVSILDSIISYVPKAKILVLTPPPLGAHKYHNTHTYILENARIYRDACIKTVQEIQKKSSRNQQNIQLLNLWDVLVSGIEYDKKEWDPASIVDLFYDTLHFSAKGNELFFGGVKEKINSAWPEMSAGRLPFKYPNPDVLPVAKSNDQEGMRKGLFANARKKE
ncbi:UNVERIFIED_CONTAM: hypothetical protein HDU68_010809 [Siphonaria sp. JEL0065]|nr:hypothetical protein HDU68_010809 [Siphonaria sp. JEL0065]